MNIGFFRRWLPTVIVALFMAGPVLAQGSIFGQVYNSDATVPDSGNIVFFGYLDDTDEEIRLESSVGAGYDVGNWFDDFQNYLTEAAGNPYDFHFYNTDNGEGFILSGSIPNNSFQQENVTLEPVSWPSVPVVIDFYITGEPALKLLWSYTEGNTYHVYRREATSDGSFYRLDDPTGLPGSAGVADSIYVDQDIDFGGAYDYLIIAEDASGNLSPHSDIMTVDITSDYFIVGDVNDDILVNVGDCVFTITYLYRGGQPPEPLESGDTNCDGLVNLGDVVYTLNFIFRDGPVCGCPWYFL